MHCNPNELTFAAKVYINGEREGTVMFYKKDGYPSHPIGHVHFLWKPSDSGTKAIWIWVHPSFYNDVLKEIISNFNFELKGSRNHFDAEIEGSQEKIKSQNEEKVAPELRIFLTTKIPIYSSADGCQLTILRNCLNRFRLCGPLALGILSDAFKVPKINAKVGAAETDEPQVVEEISPKKESEDKENSWQMDVDADDKPDHSIDSWYKTYYHTQDNLEAFKVQGELFDSLGNSKSPNQLPPNMVLALTVLDPRFFLPKKRSKSVSNSQITGRTPMPPTLANRSPLWDSSVQSYVTKNCLSATAIHKLRSQSLVPGVQNDRFLSEDIMHKIPILLIQKPGDYAHNNAVGFGSGIDIVLPAGWSMPFWLALILRCARPAGLRESKSIAYENSNLNMPAINHPDTEAYRVEADFEKSKLMERYFRLPPNKRTNYVKFGITSPFSCEWKLLVKEWTDADSFYVLRDRRILSVLSSRMSSFLERKKKVGSENVTNDVDGLIQSKNCLVPVKVTIKRKGLPKDFSIICLPTQEDLMQYKKNKKWSGPRETPKQDGNEEKRRTLRRGHLALLRRLRRQRIRAKKKMENASCNVTPKDSSDVKHLSKFRQLVKKKLINANKTIVDQQARTMAKLYLPDCKSVRHSCDREVIGYVAQGGFSFSEAKGVGLGYIVVPAVVSLMKEKSNVVLVRNTATRKFRMCKLDVLS